MTPTEHNQVVSPEMVQQHLAGWHAFTKFVTFHVVAVVVLLILMAIFLL